MDSAMKNLEWIDSITTPLAKYEKLTPEEQLNKFPTGVLKHDTEAREYCDMYKDIIDVHQGRRKTITQDDFEKKI
jgi:2-oxoglutarate ferredoxin oxidoreductase subunit beta